MSEGQSDVSRLMLEVNSGASVASELVVLLLSPHHRWRRDAIGIVCSGIKSGNG